MVNQLQGWQPGFIFAALCFIPLANAQSTPVPANKGLPQPEHFPEIDCCIRSMALDYALERVSHSGAIPDSQSVEKSISEALRIPTCNFTAIMSLCPPKRHTKALKHKVFAKRHVNADAIQIHVSPTGNNDAAGTLEHPLRTLLAARNMMREKRKNNKGVNATVYLHGGVYRLNETLILGPEDGGDSSRTVLWTNWENDQVFIKGSTLLDDLKLEWREAPSSSGTAEGTLVARIPTNLNINSLYQNGQRLTRARFPNAKTPPDYPEAQCMQAMEVYDKECCCDSACGMNGTGLPPFNSPSWMPPFSSSLPSWTSNNTLFAHPTTPVLPKGGWGSDSFRGPHDMYKALAPYTPLPPGFQYWISPERGPYDRISGVSWKGQNFTKKQWKNASTAIVHMQHGFFWGSWQFSVQTRDEQNQQLKFWYGGYQAGGWDGGGPYFIENVLEELDAPGEWFYDDVSHNLYLYPNVSESGNMLSTHELEAVTLDSLFRIEGNDDNLVGHLVIQGITFAQTSTTFLRPFSYPSGGDYRIFWGGSVFIQNARNVEIVGNSFQDIGGQALFLSGYVADSMIQNNHFVRIGESAVLSAGIINPQDPSNGTSMTTPRRNVFKQNHIHRIGMYGKQSAGFFQSLSCGNSYIQNVIYDGPRHGFSYNDHYGGGALATENLVFNQMKESRVGGPFNDWDRSVYWQRDNCQDDGKVTEWPEYNVISKNFMINGYAGHANLDHDDGGWRFLDVDNLLVYGTMENHDGTNKLYKGNLILFPGILNHSQYSKPCFEDTPDKEYTNLNANNTFQENICVVTTDFAVMPNLCNYTAGLNRSISVRSYNNTFYTPSGDFLVHCACSNTPGSPKTCFGNHGESTNLTLATLQKEKIDNDSHSSTIPNVAQILTMAKSFLERIDSI
eukprot:m.129188 g.129188  ORF g.129188 m.129188 type:complete len:900 (+) comp14573_c0_seq3:288-2987(+)